MQTRENASPLFGRHFSRLRRLFGYGLLAISPLSLFGIYSCRAPVPPLRPEAPTAPASPAAPAPVPVAAWTESAVSPAGAPSPRQGHSAVVAGHLMVVLGGENEQTGLADGGAYDAAADRWTSLALPAPMAPRFLLMAAAGQLGGRDVVFAWGGTEFVSVTERRGTHYGDGAVLDLSTMSWTPVTNTGAPSIRAAGCVAWGSGVFFIWGGENQQNELADGGTYDPAVDAWTSIPWTSTGTSPGAPATGPVGRQGHHCAWDATRGEFLVYGGYADAQLGDLWGFSPSTRTWTQHPVTGAPAAHFNPTVAFGGSSLLVYGGYRGAAQQGGFLVDLGGLSATTVGGVGGPYQTLADDQEADFTPWGYVLTGLASNRTDTEAYLLGPGGDWSVISNLKDPDSESPAVGRTIRLVEDQVVLWGGRNLDGTLNNRGLRIRRN